jgi:hypothetical protein
MENHLSIFPKLVELDLLRFNNCIFDTTLAKVLNSCTKSLTSFKIGYGCTSERLGLGSSSTIALAKCRLLKKLTLGDPEEYHRQKTMDGRIFNVKKLLTHKQF